MSQDIGNPTPAGSFTAANGIFTVAGSGNDGKKSETFHFLYQTLSGDGEIVARLHSLQDAGNKARAGVMFRQSLTPGSQHAMVAVAPNNTAWLWYRRGADQNSFQSGKTNLTLPVWLRLARRAGVLTGYISQDGQSYVALGTEEVDLSGAVYVGLAVTSGSDGALSTAQFDGVIVEREGSAGGQMAIGAQVEASSAVVEASSPELVEEVPAEYALRQNYPNPFNPTTRIEVHLPESQHVTLRVYDLLGREVAMLMEGTLSAGRHVVSWDGRELNSGMYVYRLEAGAFSASKVMVLLK
jgi:hypothetical protein